MAEECQCVEAKGRGGAILLVDFDRRGDRYGHVISIVTVSGRPMPLFESIEGDVVDTWPASPPLQSLRMEELPDGRRVALLLGMAGRSHWSASVEAAPGEAKLIFDIACRHPAGAGWLGSRYRRLPAGNEAEVIQAEGARVVSDESDVVIEAEAMADGAATARWRYSVRAKGLS